MSPSEALQVALLEACRAVYEVNAANGWFDDNRTFGDEMMLVVTEAAEAMEAFRDDGFTAAITETGKPIGVASECADIFIRLLDTCWRHDIDLGAEFECKLAYNRTRGYRHGGKNL